MISIEDIIIGDHDKRIEDSDNILIDRERFQHGIDKLRKISEQHPGYKYCNDMARYFEKLLEEGE